MIVKGNKSLEKKNYDQPTRTIDLNLTFYCYRYRTRVAF